MGKGKSAGAAWRVSGEQKIDTIHRLFVHNNKKMDGWNESKMGQSGEKNETQIKRTVHLLVVDLWRSVFGTKTKETHNQSRTTWTHFQDKLKR